MVQKSSLDARSPWCLLCPQWDMDLERRTDQREPLQLEVHLADGGTGLTRNVSSSGMLIDIECSPPPGSVIDFAFSLPTAGGRLDFQARGEVVRMHTNTSGGTAVAVRVLATRLKPLE